MMLCNRSKSVDKELREHGVKLVYIEDNKIRVRWDVYNRYEVNEKIYRKMNNLLLSSGIFSRDMKGNWIILAADVLISICIDGFCFTREEDVMEYFEEKYGKAQYPCRILHVDEAYRR